MKVLFCGVTLLVLRTIRASSPFKDVEDQIDWLRSNGGFLSENVGYKNDESTSGMIALKPISKGEKIIVLPKKLMITSGLSGDMCDTARNLVKEYYLQDASDYAPYVHYLYESFPHKLHPLAWSRDAKDVMAMVVGRELEPQRFGQGSFYDSCLSEGSQEDTGDADIFEAAWRIVQARSWEDKLLPIVDMLNHRNGRYHNVDQANSAHIDEDVIVVALRDINAGEQLYNSYNECPDIDCEGIALTYGAPQMLNDYGFVEEVPRRFNFFTNNGYLVFDVDILENNHIKVIWLSKQPSLQQINWLRGHLHRLEDVYDDILIATSQLQSSHEKNTIVKYLESLMQALKASILAGKQASRTKEIEESKFTSNHDTLRTPYASYDKLDAYHDPLHYHNYICDADVRDRPKGRVVFSDELKTHYQLIEYKYFFDFHSRKMDKCLLLDSWLHSCSSYRPHYHEWLVHYPARFLTSVKRVLFMGAGDSMILSEVLRYPEIELVVGLELDQQVVRSSFKHFDTQPHFDDERVEWWFGDAVESLKMIPETYFGSFDLVVIDLLSYVIESLKVTAELDILEFTMLLLKPKGVVSFNDDFVSRTYGDYAQYMVDLNYLDVPILCQTHVNIGSNGIDFLFADQIDHGVETIIVQQEKVKKFDAWWNYRKASQTIIDDVGKQLESPPSVTTIDNGSNCMMIILEIEELREPPHHSTITNTLKEAGLTILSFSSPQPNVLFVALEEGYIVLRNWPEFHYYAFDILLWKDFNRHHFIKTKLVAAVGGQSSSFRVVATGLHKNSNEIQLPLNETRLSAPQQPEGRTASTEFKILDVIVEKMIESKNHTFLPVLLVFCDIEKQPCMALDLLQSLDERSVSVVPIWSCTNVNKESSQGHLDECNRKTYEALHSAASQTKVNGIILDVNTPKIMGEMIYEILSKSHLMDKLFAYQYFVLAPSLKSTDLWGKVLMERFRASLVYFSPAYHAEISIDFNSTKAYGVEIFSSGDHEFYAHLLDIVQKCENSTGIPISVKSVQDGLLNYVADFEATNTATDADYDNFSARDQWESQRSMGMQTLYQFTLQPQPNPLLPGNRVFRKIVNHAFVGTWKRGTVESRNKDGSYDVIDEDGDITTRLARDHLINFDSTSKVAGSLTGRVLIRQGNTWSQGKIMEQLLNSTYKVHVFDNFGSQPLVLHEDLIMQTDTLEIQKASALSCRVLESIVSQATDAFMDAKINILREHIDMGCTITAFWPTGNAILTWDTLEDFGLNLFTVEEDIAYHQSFANMLMEKIKFLAIKSHNQHPRGFGRVVNFKRDMSV